MCLFLTAPWIGRQIVAFPGNTHLFLPYNVLGFRDQVFLVLNFRMPLKIFEGKYIGQNKKKHGPRCDKLVCEQQRCRPAFAFAQSCQHLCYSLNVKYLT